MLLHLQHLTYTDELVGNTFAPSNSLWTWVVCIKILGKMEEVLGDRAS